METKEIHTGPPGSARNLILCWIPASIPGRSFDLSLLKFCFKTQSQSIGSSIDLHGSFCKKHFQSPSNFLVPALSRRILHGSSLVGYLLKSKTPDGLLNTLAFVIFAIFGIYTAYQALNLISESVCPITVWPLLAAVTVAFVVICVWLYMKKKKGQDVSADKG